ncbi:MULTISPECIES: MoaD/ThiS family protein [unclassified Rhizobacter]|uniref:MoaD/ThiS family protein n=1 Tax=unclassified Rhizobacter TaxID=2640088 RepID=UPI0006FB9CBF|nr:MULTISPECIES: MoaD/ThiS family protein [unclassified Rhizobacter]KQU81017.1 molybdopterin synthase sulfur carrier subunit [Rhizobacter sp. Root29]KQW04561.1 molybdopterin synthase sulfur carrier subunit [Rhizobacter sp. Root1238]KRB06403.1 molybdopterin synthase sulfur carrier subunit [Rhizobacter sp. Root16D2]
MKLRIRYFASLREALGSSESLELPAGADVAAARDALIARSERHAAALARTRALRCALDQALCDEATLLHDDAELAFFPPVTGG